MTRKSALIGFVLLCLVIRLKFAFGRVLLPFQLDYEEGNILNTAVRVLHGQSPYPAAGSFPYILSPYGPVGYLLAALGVQVGGLSLLGPRLLVFIGGIGILFVIAALVECFGGQWQIGFLFGSLFICSPLVRLWFPLLRVDFWAILLTLLGLYIFFAFPRGWPCAAAVFALALLTKQTTIAAPAACILELFARRSLRQASLFTATVAGIVLACVLCFGADFAFAFVKTHPDPYSVKRAVSLYLVAIEGSQLVLAVVVYAVAKGFRWGEGSRVAWFYFAACSVTALTAGKLGSETNHFLEWTAAISIMGGLTISYLLESQEPLARPFTIGVAALTAIFALGPRYSLAVEANPGGCQKAYEFVRSFPGDRLLSEDVTSLVLNGKPVLVSNPFVATQLADSVAWSRGSMEQLVQQQYFDLIVLGGDIQDFAPESGRWSPGVIEAVRERYRPTRRFQCFPNFVVAYVPTLDSR